MSSAKDDVETGFLPYSRPCISEADIEAVADVLRGTIISQGAILKSFESQFAAQTKAEFAVGLSSGTAALHAMCHAAGIGPGDEVILPALTFAGTANAVRYTGARPVFADIDMDTYCMCPDAARSLVGNATRAILTVDFAGRPSYYDELRETARGNDLLLLSDAAHAPGASLGARPVGSLADMTAFSFNPIKNMTSGEGGMVTTDHSEYASRLGQFRVHGMTRDPQLLEEASPAGWYYEQQFLGFNYKMSELHAALGLSQLARLAEFNNTRARLASVYQELLSDLPLVLPSADAGRHRHAFHLFVVRLLPSESSLRDQLFEYLRARGIGVQLHYVPVPLHPDYRRLGYKATEYPNAMKYYRSAISLPLHPAMGDDDCVRVADLLAAFLHGRSRL